MRRLWRPAPDVALELRLAFGTVLAQLREAEPEPARVPSTAETAPLRVAGIEDDPLNAKPKTLAEAHQLMRALCPERAKR